MTKIAHSTIALRTAKTLLLTFESLVVLTSLVVLIGDRSKGSLFGREAGESALESMSFAPAAPFSSQGLEMFTYPLVHQSFEHLVISGALLVLLGIRLAKVMPSRLRIAFCGVATVAVAWSFSLPIAPLATQADRVFGLSALAHAHLGASLILRPTLLATSIFIVLVVATLFDPPSALTMWGHGAGFTIGLATAVLFRLARSANSSAASA